MPLVARAAEFGCIAEEVRAERRALKVARETLTLLRRDIVKLIAYGLEEALPGDWLALEERYRTIMLPCRARRCGKRSRRSTPNSFICAPRSRSC